MNDFINDWEKANMNRFYEIKEEDTNNRAKLEKEIGELQRSCSELEEQNESLVAALRSKDTANKHLRSSNESLFTFNGMLTNRLNDSINNRAQLEMDIKKLENSNTFLTDIVNRNNSNTEKLEKQIKSLADFSSTVEDCNHELGVKNFVLTTENDKLKKQIEELTKDNEKLTKVLIGIMMY